MRSPVRSALIAVFAFTVAALGGPAAYADDRYAAIVMDARTGEVLLDDQAQAIRYPASLTKMMTLYMVFDALEHGELALNTRLTASRNAARQPPSRLGLRRGDSITVDQAIQAMAVQSANDVATMIAERLGGSESRFAAQMTARARALGMTETRFMNASGLPDPLHHSTARDLAVLAQALWRDFPQYYGYFQTESFSWRRHYGRNHNHLLGEVEGLDGIKTGYTRASGFNLATSTERGGHRVIVVVLGGESAAARDSQVTYLIDGAFEEYARRDDPNAATFANLPTHRLDVQLAPGALNASVASAADQVRPMPGAPHGEVVETLSPVRAPLAPQTPARAAAPGDENPDD
jgi:D-alanyl-D-alanine carboxypeptidase